MQLLVNSNFAVWSNGPNALPSCWTCSAAGGGTLPTFSRQSSGVASPYFVRMTRQNANCFLTQNSHGAVMPGLPPIEMVRGKIVTYASLIRWNQPSSGGVVDWAPFANATFSDAVTETHTGKHRGYGEWMLLSAQHYVALNAPQICFNPLTIKRDDFGAGVYSADLAWCALWIGDRVPFYWEEGVYGRRISSLSFSSCPGEQVAAGSTAYMGHSGVNPGEDTVMFPMPYHGILRKLALRSGASPGAGESYAFNVRAGSVDLALACTTTGADQQSQDYATEIYIPQGTFVDLKVVTSGGAAPTNHRASVEIEMVPGP